MVLMNTIERAGGRRRGAASLVLALAAAVAASQQYALPVDIGAGAADRADLAADVPVDLSLFLAGLGEGLDPYSFQVVEVDSAGALLNEAVPFQFDPAPGFDAWGYAAGDIVLLMDGATAAGQTRRYRILFDVAGACLDCPPPALPAQPVYVDSLVYENQMTYVVDTPRADYYYHKAGAGLASLFDNDAQDWITFHDIPGSGSSGEYRGIPNMVFVLNNAASSFFHPGFTNATTTLVSAGPLKVAMRSVTNSVTNEWIVLWEYYPTFARLTVEQTGTSNGGSYWYLYEGTPGGALDAGDVVVRSDGTVTSAMGGVDVWEQVLTDPQWVYFHDTAGSRFLYVSDDLGDTAPDSYRAQGPTSGATPDMTVFGFGRVLHTSSSSLVPRMSGAGRTFTLGLGEDAAFAAQEIDMAVQPLDVAVGEPVDRATAVGDGLPALAVLRQNRPNPFNPVTSIGFSLPQGGPARVTVYDSAGRRVRTLLDDVLPAGDHSVMWDGRMGDGRAAASGVYVYRLETAAGVQSGKMTLVE